MIGFLTHLNGAVATALLCALLYVDELGVPLPFAPNEVLLLIAGLLIASGVLVPWIFIPAAFVFMAAGMLTGVAWARALGSDRLHDLADHIDAGRSYERAVQRLQRASLVGIATARLLPGVRVYATLAAGASGMRMARFLAAAVPALAIWLVALVIVGDLAGRPAAGLISRVDSIVLTGVLLIVLGGASFLVLRHVPRDRIRDEDRTAGVPRSVRYLLALAVDVGVAGSLFAGTASLGGHFLPFLGEVHGLVIVAAVLLIGYVVLARRGAGATFGEGLFAVDFRSLLHFRRDGGEGGERGGRATTHMGSAN